MANLVFTTQPVASTIFVGTNTTFNVEVSTNLVNPAGYTYQWSVSTTSPTDIVGATSSSLGIDPNFSDTGSVYTVSVSALSATSTGLSAALVAVSNGARITVIDNPVPPYNVRDVYPESGVARQLRLRLLGYI
jgi:hypothetical protein